MAKKKVNKHIKKFNKKRHFTVKQAANEIGVSRQQIHNWIASGVLNTAFKYAKGTSQVENFWAVYKYNVQDVKESHRSAYGGQYISEVLPHHRFIIYSLVVSRFNYSRANDFCSRYGLRFVSRKSCENLIKYLCNRIKTFSPAVCAAIRAENFGLFNFDDPEWNIIMDDLEIKSLYDDFDGIPWGVFSQPITKYSMDVCVARLSNDEVQQYFKERFDIELTRDEIAMYRNYIFDTRIMTKDQVEMYMSMISPEESSFKRGLLRGSMQAFKYKLGITDQYDLKDSAIHRHSVMNELFDIVAEDVEDPLMRYKATGAITGLNKGAIDNEKQIYEHEDRKPELTGVDNTLNKVKLDFKVEEKNDAIPIDEYEGNIMSGNMKKKFNHGEDEQNESGTNAS